MKKRKKKELKDSPLSQITLNGVFNFNDYNDSDEENNNPDKDKMKDYRAD